MQRNNDTQEEKSHDEYLDNVREKILILLAQHDRLEAGQISALMRTGIEFSLFHLEELKKSGMVTDRHAPGAPTSWELIQNGRDYLVHHGLVS